MKIILRLTGGIFAWTSTNDPILERPEIKRAVKCITQKSQGYTCTDCSIEVTKFPVVIGRMENFQYLPEIAFHPAMNSVSRKHAVIYQEHDGLHVKDLGSKYGTSVERAGTEPLPVDQEKGVLLQDKDRIIFAPGRKEEKRALEVNFERPGILSRLFGRATPVQTDGLDKQASAEIIQLLTAGTEEGIDDAQKLVILHLGVKKGEKILSIMSLLREYHGFRDSKDTKERRLYDGALRQTIDRIHDVTRKAA